MSNCTFGVFVNQTCMRDFEKEPLRTIYCTCNRSSFYWGHRYRVTLIGSHSLFIRNYQRFGE